MGVGGKLTETETETEAFDIDSSPELIFPQLAKSFSFVRNSPPPSAPVAADTSTLILTPTSSGELSNRATSVKSIQLRVLSIYS